jgi:dihydropyrimidine dehydrogenase (NAD+) subunit PreA
VAIPQLMDYAKSLTTGNDIKKCDLSIEFCGIPCENPFFLSSSVVASNYEMVARAFDMGWAGAAFKTIGTFVPDEVSPRFAITDKTNHAFTGFKNIEQISDHTLEENSDFLMRLKQDYPTKIIIASILGQNEEEWTFLAQRMTEAGADIIECNFSCPHMSGEGLGSDVGQDPELVKLYTAATRKGTHLPILAKMTPNIGNMEIPAMAAMETGANGLAAINTIKSIMNISLDDFSSEPQVDGKSSVGGYSGKTVKPIALRFIHDMKKHPKLQDAPISGMGGIETWVDAAEFIALGCENIQITTAVMQYGYRIIDDLIDGLSTYLGEKGLASLRELVGRALPQLVPADELNRHSIAYPKFDKQACIGCGRCYLSCLDGGHQALAINEADSKPRLLAKKCVGCQLCSLVCPVGAISVSQRVERVK